MPESEARNRVNTKPDFYLHVYLPKDRDREIAAGEFIKVVKAAARRHSIHLAIALPEQPKQPAVERSGAALSGRAPDPAVAWTRDGFLSCLRTLVTWAGVPQYRDLAERAKQAGRDLSKSTAQRILAPERGAFPSRTALEAIVIACGLDVEQLSAWTTAWERCQEAGLDPATYTYYYYEPGFGYYNPKDGSYSTTPTPRLLG